MHRTSTKRADEKKAFFVSGKQRKTSKDKGKMERNRKKIFDHFNQLIECKLIY